MDQLVMLRHSLSNSDEMIGWQYHKDNQNKPTHPMSSRSFLIFFSRNFHKIFSQWQSGWTNLSFCFQKETISKFFSLCNDDLTMLNVANIHIYIFKLSKLTKMSFRWLKIRPFDFGESNGKMVLQKSPKFDIISTIWHSIFDTTFSIWHFRYDIFDIFPEQILSHSISKLHLQNTLLDQNHAKHHSHMLAIELFLYKKWNIVAGNMIIYDREKSNEVEEFLDVSSPENQNNIMRNNIRTRDHY